ncbi:hypothetical protein [Pandoravirus japonicus]|uniref:Uncharacterized protein n=1 Tax=Pandoravirus japonicus TaxID=2823154 RepID=A0A811BMD1_9VIRU|nr:hypothetical protein [Pandoravirus japonicus]
MGDAGGEIRVVATDRRPRANKKKRKTKKSKNTIKKRKSGVHRWVCPGLRVVFCFAVSCFHSFPLRPVHVGPGRR